MYKLNLKTQRYAYTNDIERLNEACLYYNKLLNCLEGMQNTKDKELYEILKYQCYTVTTDGTNIVLNRDIILVRSVLIHTLVKLSNILRDSQKEKSLKI